jgi:hypothetical protein
MPVINGEAAYEMLGDNLPTKWTRQMFWLCMTNGACGHTYGANGIWQCNRPGQPHGPSPHHPPNGHGYGKIPWNESMNLPGSDHVGYGKELFAKYAWHEFAPHPEWAKYADEPSSYGPYATGIPGKVRIIYVPEPRSIHVQEIESGARYRAAIFDPHTGKTADLGAIEPDDDASWKGDVQQSKIEAPDDWVLILERTE